MKILVTGGTTFVSKYVAEHFVKKNHEVYVLNRNNRKQIDGVSLINCDRTMLKNRLKGKYFDVILDITAYNEYDIKTLLSSGVEFNDYIFISSSAVYPETNPQPFTEEQPRGKNSIWGDYGLNKLKAEKYLTDNFSPAYILRPPYFYGIYENLYREVFVFDCAEKDRVFYLPKNEDMKLQFFNVCDLCRFIEIVFDKHPENRIFNVGNKDTVTVREWVELCYKAVGKDVKLKNVPESYEQRDYFCFYNYEYILDVTKQNELMPDTLPLIQGLKREYNWYKNNRNSIYNRKPYIEFIDKNFS